MRFAEYEQYDCMGLADLVRRGETTPAELIDAAIERIERHNPVLNAVVTRAFEQARTSLAELPNGPLRGVPFLLKDLIVHMQGVRLTEGCRYLSDYVSDHDSEIVRRYKAAGLVILGRTNTPELGLLPYTEPELHGPTRNPWNPAHTSGGSSGGSGAAVASRMVAAAHGGDGGGSIRMPASCSGVFGLKPTRGRTPKGPDASESWHGLAVDHVLSRSVRDSAALLDVAAGPEPGSPYWAPPNNRTFLSALDDEPRKLRITCTTRPWLPAKVHPECITAAERAADLCKELGHEVGDEHFEVDPRAFARHLVTVIGAETAADIARWGALRGRPPQRDDFETGTWLTVLLARRQSAEDLCVAVKELQAIARRLAEFFERWDVVLTPTLAQPPPRIGELKPKGAEAAVQAMIARLGLGVLIEQPRVLDAMLDRVFNFLPFTPLANIAGVPSMSVPLHWSPAELPIGACFTARFGAESTLFRLAADLERARPWAERTPPLLALPREAG